MRWTAADMPDFTGRTVVVTGANSGLGFAGARGFAAAGAEVVLACRSAEKAEAALEAIRRETASANVAFLPLDLASLASIREFAARFANAHTKLDVLCNNAGVMALPRRETADGFEMQLGTNHFGHFALTGLLLPRILAAPAARVVNQSSTAHRFGRIDFDDLNGTKRYRKWWAYGQSKLANLLFTFELQRRLERKSASAISVACHPGYSATELQTVGARMEGATLMERIFELGNRLLAQSAEEGVRPMLYAAAAPDVRGGDYYGPDGFGELWGNPVKVGTTAAARDAHAAARLWSISAEMTGVRYEALDA